MSPWGRDLCVETCSSIYICYKWCITDWICWTIYLLFFNLALFHCTITAATHKYRPTAVHDVSINQPFSASNCAVFSSSVYVCYMWEWEMWPLYTSWWIHCTMNCPVPSCNDCTSVTLSNLISLLSNWAVQCVHLHNTQLNCDSTFLISHNWIEETEVDIRMQINVYMLQFLILYLSPSLNLLV